MRLRFADCVFDGETREVLRGERPVKMSPKAFELLAALVEARPNPVSKSDIHARLWPGIHVAEGSLHNLIVQLRAALGDDAGRARIIRTVPRFGYAFRPAAGNARSGSGTPRRAPRHGHLYRLIWGAREIALDPGENLIGRQPGAVVRIDDERVSRRHARIVIGDDGAAIEDLGSKNRT